MELRFFAPATYISTQTHKNLLTKLTKNRRSQSALEYLMTYGWAILIIVIVAVVLYSLGIFSPSSSISSTVTGFAGLGSTSVVCYSNGSAVITFGDNLGQPITLQYINVMVNGITQSLNSINGTQITANSLHTFILPDSCPTTLGERYSLIIQVAYKEPQSFSDQIQFSTGTAAGSTALGQSTALPTILTNFTEMNLPIGATWNVTYGGIDQGSTLRLFCAPFCFMTGDKLSFNTSIGIHFFSVPSVVVIGSCNNTYGVSPSSGDYIAGTNNTLEFSTVSELCQTTFAETGLPFGTLWNVTYNSIYKTSDTNSTTFYTSLSGELGFTLYRQEVDGCVYVPYNASSEEPVFTGTLTTGGTFSIDYVLSYCITTLNENGLPDGTAWNATFNMTLYKSSTNTISINTSNGTSQFAVNTAWVSGTPYCPTPNSGIIAAGSVQDITYASGCVVTTFLDTGLENYTNFSYYSAYANSSWHVDYDALNISAPTNENIYINTPTGATEPFSSGISSTVFNVSVYSPINMSCLGAGMATRGSVNTPSWNCETTFYTPNDNSTIPWNITYDSIMHQIKNSNSTIFSTDTGLYKDTPEFNVTEYYTGSCGHSAISFTINYPSEAIAGTVNGGMIIFTCYS